MTLGDSWSGGPEDSSSGPLVERVEEVDGSQPAGPMVALRVGAVVVGLALLIVVWALATSEPASQRQVTSELLGKAVPPLAGQTLDGTAFDIDQHRGKWVVVNFFASWCVPCIREHPELVSFEERNREDVQVVSVVFDDEPDAVQEFFDREGGDWPVVVGETGRISLDFGVKGVPESYVISPSGVVVAAFFGVTEQALEEVIGVPAVSTVPAGSDPPVGEEGRGAEDGSAS